MPAGRLERFGARGAPLEDLEVLVFEQQVVQAVQYERVIIREDDPNRAGRR